MTGKKITLNEGLEWLETLQDRHKELVALRDVNSNKETRYYGVGGDKSTTKEPVYDIVSLDSLITNIAREIRNVGIAIKVTNNATVIGGYEMDDAVLGNVAAAAKKS